MKKIVLKFSTLFLLYNSGLIFIYDFVLFGSWSQLLETLPLPNVRMCKFIYQGMLATFWTNIPVIGS